MNNNLNFKIDDGYTTPKIIKSIKDNYLLENLNDMSKIHSVKSQIDVLNKKTWDKLRKCTNSFDFPNYFFINADVFNRAFYKFWEINSLFDLSSTSQCYSKLSFHIAEAPGSFIHALSSYRKSHCSSNGSNSNSDGFTTIKKKGVFKYETISLICEESPVYNKRIIDNKNVTIITSNNGDILNENNINDLISRGRNCYLITADGGVDDNGVYNAKEKIHSKLIECEILLALFRQDEGGNFLCKVYDIITNKSLEFIWLLTFFYKQVFIYKPLTSRETNSEKYIICKGFFNTNISILEILKDKFIKNINNQEFGISIDPESSPEFKKKLYEVNETFINHQSQSIIKVLSNIKNINSRDFIKDSCELKKKSFCKWSNTFK